MLRTGSTRQASPSRRALHIRATMASSPKRCSILWLKRELRLGDNAALDAAARSCDWLLPVYVLDPREFEPRNWPQPQTGPAHGTVPACHGPLLPVPKLGPWRCRMLLEALHALRASLATHGSGLLYRAGRPEEVLPHLVDHLAHCCEVGHIALHHHEAVLEDGARIDTAVEAAVRAAAARAGVRCEVSTAWDLTLYHPEDLPGRRHHSTSGSEDGDALRSQANRVRRVTVAPVMTDFRKALQAAKTVVRPPLPVPKSLPPLPSSCTASQQPGSPADNTKAANLELGGIPTAVQQAYKAAGAADALTQLGRLVGQDYWQMSLEVGGLPDSRSAFQFQGGEDAALTRLRYYLWGPQAATSSATGPGTADVSPIAGEDGTSLVQPPAPRPPALSYFSESRAQAVGVDSSTKLSAYLALGCITPRTVWWEVAHVEEHAPSDSCAWLQMHLQIRDYYLLTAMKHGLGALTRLSGIQGTAPAAQGTEVQGAQSVGVDGGWSTDMATFSAWARGATGLPFVDACMRELAGSGWMSNRGRQNVASLLSKELRVDWRMGAALFESLLLDHEAGVNLANWGYFSGTGTDPRNRRFKTVTQGMQYDADARLAATWLPELAHLPPAYRHAPWGMSVEEASQLGFELGVTYPAPLVTPDSQTGVLAAAGGKQKKQKKPKGM